MKKILLSALVSTVFSASVLANAPSQAFNGFYLGAGVNYSQEKFTITEEVTGPRSGSDKANVSLKGGGVKFFGGYGTLVSQGLYLGGELTLGFDRLFGSNNKKALSSNKKLNYGIAARLGYAFCNVLPYVKFGYEGRPSMKSLITTVKRSGWILGGGVDVAVNKNVFIRAEYVHGFGATSKSSASTNLAAGNAFNVPAGRYTLNERIKTKSDTFMIGAAYKF